jgi:hypothetical protein
MTIDIQISSKYTASKRIMQLPSAQGAAGRTLRVLIKNQFTVNIP